MESVEDVEFASFRGPLLSGRHAAVARGMPDWPFGGRQHG